MRLERNETAFAVDSFIALFHTESNAQQRCTKWAPQAGHQTMCHIAMNLKKTTFGVDHRRTNCDPQLAFLSVRFFV